MLIHRTQCRLQSVRDAHGMETLKKRLAMNGDRS